MTGNGPRYGVIYADPPWRYDFVPSKSRAIENHYATMALPEICQLPVTQATAESAVLFLWSTPPKAAEAMDVVGAWGFRYRTQLVWDKLRIGMGRYARQQHELLYIAIRGQPGTPSTDARFPSVIRAVRGKHSAKPEAVYHMIERMYPHARRLELFARPMQLFGTPFVRPGWDAWGLDTDASGRIVSGPRVTFAGGESVTCTVCGAVVSGRKRGAGYCSPACRQKAYRQRRRAPA